MSTELPLIDNLAIYEGDDVKLSFTSRLADISGYSIKLQVRIDQSSRYDIISVAGTITGTNTYDLDIPSAITIGKGTDKAYVYGIQLTAPNGMIYTDRRGTFVIQERTTALTTLSVNNSNLVDTTGLETNEILKWDATTQKLVGSGVLSEVDGDLTTAANSINIGVHDLGSAGRNIMVTNRVDNRHFSFVGQEISLDDSMNTNTIQRERGPVQEYHFGDSSATDLINPSWSFTTQNNETVMAIAVWPSKDMLEVEYCIYEQGKIIYRDIIGTLTKDNISYLELPTPYDLYAGTDYSATLRCADGSAVFRGGVDGRPWYKVKIRNFEVKELATKEYVAAMAGSIDGTFTSLSDTPSAYTEPGQIVRVNQYNTGLEFKPNTFEDMFSDVNITSPQAGDVLYYTGSQWQNEVPIPDVNTVAFKTGSTTVGMIEDYTSNILWVENGQETIVTMPVALSSHFLWVTNKNTALGQEVLLNPRQGTTINNTTNGYSISPQSSVVLLWNASTDDWEIVDITSIAPPDAPEPVLNDAVSVIGASAQGTVGTVKPDTSLYIYSSVESSSTYLTPRVDSSNLNPFIYVVNQAASPTAELRLDAESGQTIEGDTFTLVPPRTYAMWRYNNTGTNWEKVFELELDHKLAITGKDGFTGTTTKLNFPDSAISTEVDGSLTISIPAPTNDGLQFFEKSTDNDPVVTSTKASFPSATVFIAADGSAVVDTAFGVADDKGNTVNETISLEFIGATVEEQNIPGRDGRTAVVIPDVSPDTVEPQHSASLLAYVANRQQINTAYSTPPALEQSNVYFDDIAWNNSPLITYDNNAHSYTLKRRPKSTEPTVYFISATLSFKADGVQDYGYIRFYANDDSAQLGEFPVITTNSGLLAGQVYYNDGENTGSVVIEGFVEVTSDKTISFHLEDSLTKDVLFLEDRNVLPSAVLIQEMRHGFRTSPAIQQYCTDFQRDIRVAHVDMSKPSSIDWLTNFNVPTKTLPAGNKGSLHAGEVFHTLNKINLEISNSDIHFQSFDASNPMDFCFGNVLTNEQTAGLRGKQVKMDISTKISDVGVLTQVMMVVWKGEKDLWTNDIYTGRDAQTKDPIFATNWSLGDVYSGSNDDTPDYKLHTDTFTIPLDAVNVGFVFLVKNTLQDAFGDIYINKFDITTDPALSIDVFSDPLFHGNNLKYADESMVFSLNSHGYASLVYNLGTTPAPMPLGYITQGGAPVIIDRTVNVNTSVPFQDVYGALSFPEEAMITLDTTLQIYNSTPTTNTVDFQWYIKHGSTGVEEPISDSLTIFPQIAPDTTVGTALKMEPVTYGVKQGDLIYLKGWSNVEGGAYIESAPRLGNDKPMIVVQMDYKRLLPPPADTIPKGDILRALFVTQDNQPAGQLANNPNSPATVTFNQVDHTASFATVDLATGIFTLLETIPVVASLEFHVIRNVDPSPQGAIYHWGFFVETSIDDGATWVKTPNSTVVETFPSPTGREVHQISATVPLQAAVPGMKLRFRYFTDNVDMLLVSLPENYHGAGEPIAAGAVFSLYGIK